MRLVEKISKPVHYKWSRTDRKIVGGKHERQSQRGFAGNGDDLRRLVVNKGLEDSIAGTHEHRSYAEHAEMMADRHQEYSHSHNHSRDYQSTLLQTLDYIGQYKAGQENSEEEQRDRKSVV